MAATPVFSAFAEAPQAGAGDGYFMGSKDVSVGEVDVTIYSVDIDWGDMTFDWKYNADTNEFNFEPHFICSANANNDAMRPSLEWLQSKGRLYSDENCTTLATGELTNATYYGSDVKDGRIYIRDNSVNGMIKSVATFTAADGYEWIDGEIGDWSLGADLEYSVFTAFEDGVLRDSTDGFGNKIEIGFLKLNKNSNPASFDFITPEDKIGTITINIEPDLN